MNLNSTPPEGLCAREGASGGESEARGPEAANAPQAGAQGVDPRAVLLDTISTAINAAGFWLAIEGRRAIADAVLASQEQLQGRAEKAEAELESARQSFPAGVRPALSKALAAVDHQAIGRLPIADRQPYIDQADAVLRLMGWREKQLTDQYTNTLKALRTAEAAVERVRALHPEGRDGLCGLCGVHWPCLDVCRLNTPPGCRNCGEWHTPVGVALDEQQPTA